MIDIDGYLNTHVKKKDLRDSLSSLYNWLKLIVDSDRDFNIVFRSYVENYLVEGSDRIDASSDEYIKGIDYYLAGLRIIHTYDQEIILLRTPKERQVTIEKLSNMRYSDICNVDGTFKPLCDMPIMWQFCIKKLSFDSDGDIKYIEFMDRLKFIRMLLEELK